MGIEERLRVLIVDENEMMRRSLSAGLRTLGYGKVTGISDAKTAIDYLESNPTDIVLSDWYMEPIDGLELLRMVRMLQGRDKTTFVLVSGEASKEKIVEAIKCGIDGYIMKPYSLNVLGVGVHEAYLRRNKK